MRKRTALMALAALLAALCLCAGIMAAKGLAFRVGRCVVTGEGDCLLLMDNAPVLLGGRTPFGRAFGSYATGDLLLVLHDGVSESWPGRTGCYFVLRLQKGGAGQVPAAVLDELAGMGWTVRR